MRKDPSSLIPTPAEKAMKQTAKTEHEVSGDAAPPAPADEQPTGTRAGGVSEGDKPVGESDSDGSSPYEEPHHLAKRQRSN